MGSSNISYSFSDIPTSAFPSGTGAPQPAPTDAQGSGASIFVCHPLDPSSVPGTSDNATMTPIPSGAVPSDVPPVSASGSVTGAPPVSTGGGGPIYICHPADSSAIPAPSGTPDNATATPIPSAPVPSVSGLGSGTGAPQPVPTGGQGSGGTSYICYPVNSAAGSMPAGIPNNATSMPT